MTFPFKSLIGAIVLNFYDLRVTAPSASLLFSSNKIELSQVVVAGNLNVVIIPSSSGKP